LRSGSLSSSPVGKRFDLPIRQVIGSMKVLGTLSLHAIGGIPVIARGAAWRVVDVSSQNACDFYYKQQIRGNDGG
jgi:hypothetical protein